jgi:hypothetical protein
MRWSNDVNQGGTMLEVCSVIGGALIVFVSLTLWASGGQFKSENDH